MAALSILCAASAPARQSANAQCADTVQMLAPKNIVVTNCNDSGPGSLRDAIESAASGDVVDMTQLTCTQIPLTTGVLNISQATLTIAGPGADRLAIDGGNTGFGIPNGIIHATGSTLLISDVSVINGTLHRSDADDTNATGGCISVDADLELTGVKMSHCIAAAAGDRSALGGAVWTGGALVLNRSTITGNSVVAQGDGYATGGGAFARRGISAYSSTVSENTANSAAAARSFGGGVFARGAVLFFQSTVSSNSADRSGGLDLDDGAGNHASIIDSTISGNSARVNGGIFARPPLFLANSTIAFNTSSVWTDGSGNHFAAGIHVTAGIEMYSTILSRNFNSGAQAPSADLTGDTGARFTGSHNNVMACDIACPADTTTEDPGLLSLRDNGGPTQTHMPTTGAWNVRGGINIGTGDEDQRGSGFPRASADGRIDIGAVQIDDIFTNNFEQ